MYKLQNSEDKNPEEDIIKRNDHCFISGTMISTARGQVPIEEITKEDMILTRGGYQKVIGCGPTSISNTIKLHFSNGASLVCTGNHPIFTQNRGFIDADDIKYSDALLHESEIECQKNLSLMERSSIDIQTQNTRDQEGIFPVLENIFIERFGLFLMGQYRRAITYITEMVTSQTTTYQTLSAFQGQSTLKSIEKRLSKSTHLQSNLSTLEKLETLLAHGTLAKREESGTLSIKKSHGLKAQLLKAFALFVPESTRLEASQKTEKNSVLRFVAKKAGNLEQVYNLSVDNFPEYFANGILVHNCYDATRYALMSENLPAEVIHDERAGFATLKAVEDDMEEDYAKKNQKDAFSCTFNELDGESEWDLRDYG
jgi:hypothetical protein